MARHYRWQAGFRRKTDELTAHIGGIGGSPEQGHLLTDERWHHILSLIQSQGSVLMGELSRKPEISRITVRKNHKYLQVKGLVERNLYSVRDKHSRGPKSGPRTNLERR